MFDVELERPFLVTVGYVGVPGDRAFHLQAEDERERVTFAIEKVQAEGLSELLGQLLVRMGSGPATDWDRSAMDLRAPFEPRWRVGAIAVGVDGASGRFALELSELAAEDERPEREARIGLDLDQARRLAAHAAEVVGEGRARCELCGRPIEPDGSHVCPSTNGHGRLTV
ncbi:MAG: hypothetical protein RLZZ272_146 [Actinomycetota bacterium]